MNNDEKIMKELLLLRLKKANKKLSKEERITILLNAMKEGVKNESLLSTKQK